MPRFPNPDVMSSCCSCHAVPPVRKAQANKTVLDGNWHRNLHLGLAILLAGLSMTFSLALNLDPPDEPIRTALHLVLASFTGMGLLVLGWPILRGALVPRLSLEHLYLIGLLGAYAASLYSTFSGVGHIYYEVVLILLAIYHLGRFALRDHTDKAADLARHLPGMETSAQVILDNGIQQRPAAEVLVGQQVRISPDELVPIDGVIVRGRAFIEELAHTGEPFPAARQPGDRVLAGSLVLDGIIDVAASCSGKDRELDRLLAACRDTVPSPAENLAQRVLAGFVPTVIIVALGTAAFWILVMHSPAAALFNALAVTIVACPCAFGLAVPIAARKSLMRLRLLGIVAQKPDLIERLAVVDAVAFDKTGTLSHPRLGLDALDVTADAPLELTAWLAAIQRRSTHPVARPFWNLSQPAILTNLSIEALPARGIEARFTHLGIVRRLRIGNEFLLDDPSQAVDSGARKLYVLLENQLVAVARLTETPRESALQTLDELRDLGVRRILLTGDTACPPEYRDSLEIYTALTTADKAKLLNAYRDDGQHVLFVGDGLNDSEGLSAAHLGIALRSGSGAAQAAAHAMLIHDDLSVIPQAITIARTARRRLVRLLTFSLAYNGIGMALAATGLLHPVAAALLMFASSATVLTAVNRPLDLAAKD